VVTNTARPGNVLRGTIVCLEIKGKLFGVLGGRHIRGDYVIYFWTVYGTRTNIWRIGRISGERKTAQGTRARIRPTYRAVRADERISFVNEA